MGLAISRILSLLQSPKHYKVLLVGLQNAGKTTILYKIKSGKMVQTASLSDSVHVEMVKHKHSSFVAFDVGGQMQNYLWKQYLPNTSGVIYIVDSKDKQRMSEAKEELHKLTADVDLSGCPVLIMANKQDLPLASPVSEITDALDLRYLKVPWFVQATCAGNGEGIYEGLDWLVDKVTNEDSNTSH